MAETRRLTAQGRERKQQLLDCAAALFAERGYEETRVIDIVRAAGVAKGLFYWYFDNKEALFRELVEGVRLGLRQAQAAAMDPNADPLQQIRLATEASMRFMAQHAHLYALLRAESVDGRAVDLLRDGTDVHVRDTAAAVQRGVDAGLVRDEDATLLAYGILGSVAYYSHFHRTGRIALPVDELAAFVGRLVVRFLAADDTIAARATAAPAAPAVPA